jgi:glycosyltransferase involved in cell wall biosynthesis
VPEGVSVIVMAYNEVTALGPFMDELHATLSALTMPHEVIVVDDGSSDGTGALADTLMAKLPNLRVIHHAQNLGLGGVYRTGFKEASRAWITFFPADGQFAAEIVPQFVPFMRDHDLVLGYLPEGRRTLAGTILSTMERVLYRGLFGRLPPFQGIFMIRRDALSRLTLLAKGRGWAIVMEMIIRASRAGFRIHSEPTLVRRRHSGASKVQNFRTVWSNLKQVMGLRRLL